jgi:hypothetical protein
MTKTRRRIALAAVLGVALAIFSADRILGWVPLGPELAEASATTSSLLSKELGEQMRETAAMTNIPPAPPTLADRLIELGQAQGIRSGAFRDAFSPADAWIARPQAPAASAAGLTEPANFRSQQFAERHRLTATAVSAGGGMAIIDGQCLTVGREMDGMKLVSVDRSSATLEGDGTSVTLMLARD